MRIFVFTWDRYDSISTPKWFDESGLDYKVLVHDTQKEKQFISHGLIKKENIIISNQPKGLAYNRNFALSLMQPGEWALFFVDDLVEVTELDEYDTFATETLPVDLTNSSVWRPKLKKKITASEFIVRCEEAITKVQLGDINLIGFAGNDNPLFRTQKWKYNVLADGRCWLVRKTNLLFDTNAQLIDDVCWTAQNIQAYGKVLVNQWVLPNCKRYTEGAFGTKTQRMEQKIKECAYLVSTYPDYIQYAEKAGWPPGSHIRIRPTRQNNQPKTIPLF